MKIRESGMPERKLWDTFFDPSDLLSKLGFDEQIGNVAEFGCGYGTFTIPASKLIGGHIFALDIDPEMIQITKETAKEHGRTNIQVNQRDFMVEGSGLPDASVDYAMLFNILHLENPEILISEVKRVLKNGDRLGVIHWNYDASTPRGPSMEIRPRPEDCIKWVTDAGFHLEQTHDLKPYHYGLVFTKV